MDILSNAKTWQQVCSRHETIAYITIVLDIIPSINATVDLNQSNRVRLMVMSFSVGGCDWPGSRSQFDFLFRR